MPKFISSTKRILVGNGLHVGVLFVIPVIITIQEHRFEIFTIVSEIHDNVDLVLDTKNLFELEGMIDSRDSCLNFLKRSIPFFAKEKIEVKPREQKRIVVEAQFVEEISGMAITKLLDAISQVVLMLKLKSLGIGQHYRLPTEQIKRLPFIQRICLGIVDLRSLGYYKIKQGVLQQKHLKNRGKRCKYAQKRCISRAR